MFSLYKDVGKTFRVYWVAYGGWDALWRSPYLQVSALLAVALCPLWTSAPVRLYDLAISVVPSMLGFSVGGYAILIAFGDEDFRLRISGADPDGTQSPFMVANAAFVHFIVVCVAAMLLSLLGKAWDLRCAYCFIASVAFVYSIACALASAFAIFQVASWYDKYAVAEKRRRDPAARGRDTPPPVS